MNILMNPDKETLFKRESRFSAFTRSELVMVLCTLVLLFAVCIPALGTRTTTRTRRVVCVNNLRKIGDAWRMSATGFNDIFPFLNPQFLGGFSPQDLGAPHWYQLISNELGTTRILICPSDSARIFGRDFSSLRPENLSYCIGLDVGFDLPRRILGGDRNLMGGISGAGYLDMPPQQAASVGWSSAIHTQQGNILQSDGGVQQYSNFGLQEVVRTSAGQTNRVILP